MPRRDRRSTSGSSPSAKGHEVGSDGVKALHDIGCVAELRQVQAYERRAVRHRHDRDDSLSAYEPSTNRSRTSRATSTSSTRWEAPPPRC